MIYQALLGGVLIGLAVSVMLVLNGRVTGISGIVRGALSLRDRDWSWRISFIAGLLGGGIVLRMFAPETLINSTDVSVVLSSLAGLLVGFGTLLGSGCTSGHGVCGISRFSIRSFVATLTFILAGIISVAMTKLFWGLI